MSLSKYNKLRKYFNTEILTDGDGNKILWPLGENERPAPPAHVGKQFPYKNAYRDLREGVKPEHLHMIDAPQLKSAEQMEREAAYLGRNRNFPKQSTKARGGDGTVRPSSRRKSFRGDQHMAFRPAPNGVTVSMGHGFNRPVEATLSAA
jgi:hypothetical protein